MYNRKTIEKLSNAKVGDVVETKKWIITVKRGEICEDCFLYKYDCHIKCKDYLTVDKENHVFTRVRKTESK